MAIKYSNAFTLALPLIMMITVSHGHTNPQNGAATTISEGGDLGLPITARVRILDGLLRCAIPQPRAPRSAPLVLATDVILACGVGDESDDYRFALAQTLSDLSLLPTFVFDITRAVVADPRELAICRLIVTFPGGVCSANLKTLGVSPENVVSGGRTYSVPVYEAKDFHYSKHY